MSQFGTIPIQQTAYPYKPPRVCDEKYQCPLPEFPSYKATSTEYQKDQLNELQTKYKDNDNMRTHKDPIFKPYPIMNDDQSNKLINFIKRRFTSINYRNRLGHDILDVEMLLNNIYHILEYNETNSSLTVLQPLLKLNNVDKSNDQSLNADKTSISKDKLINYCLQYLIYHKSQVKLYIDKQQNYLKKILKIDDMKDIYDMEMDVFNLYYEDLMSYYMVKNIASDDDDDDDDDDDTSSTNEDDDNKEVIKSKKYQS